MCSTIVSFRHTQYGRSDGRRPRRPRLWRYAQQPPADVDGTKLDAGPGHAEHDGQPDAGLCMQLLSLYQFINYVGLIFLGWHARRRGSAARWRWSTDSGWTPAGVSDNTKHIFYNRKHKHFPQWPEACPADARVQSRAGRELETADAGWRRRERPQQPRQHPRGGQPTATGKRVIHQP